MKLVSKRWNSNVEKGGTSQAFIYLSAVVRLFLQCKLVGEYLWGPLWIWWYCHHTLQPQWQIGFRSWHLSWSLAASESGRRFPSYGRDQEKLHPRKVKAQIYSMCDKFRMGSSSSGASIKHTFQYNHVCWCNPVTQVCWWNIFRPSGKPLPLYTNFKVRYKEDRFHNLTCVKLI